ncbi:MAG TPA: phytanoyl-CoA dioxygenase family protein [Nitriliruptorales bacterium]
MQIGEWKATQGLNELYIELREQGLEPNVAELETFGFTVVEGALPPHQTTRLRERCLEVTADRIGEPVAEDGSNLTGRTEMMQGMVAEGQEFEELLLNPAAVSLLTFMLGESYVLNSLHAFVKGPDTASWGNLHIDSPMPDPLPRYAQVANCNFLLTDYTLDAGPIAFVPGSHRLSRHPRPEDYVPENLVPIEAPAGSMVAFHGNTWHTALGRTLPGMRVNLIYYACRSYVRPQEFYLHRLTDEVFARNPERFRRILGGDLPFTDQVYDRDKRTGRIREASLSQHR